MINHISIVIITKNSGATLTKCLESVKAFSEVVIYDNGSTDDSLEVSKQYSNVKLYQGDFLGFGPTKNHAISLASNDWVFSLDSDETLSEALVTILSQWSVDTERHQVAEVRRENQLMGKVVRHGGWGDDWLVRLCNRQVHSFTDSPVHEKIELNSASEIKRLEAPIIHDAVNNIGQFLEKVNYYSEIRKKTSTKTYTPSIILLKSLFAFFRSYVLKRGFLAGWRGLVIAVSNANGVFFKYMKIYAERHR